MKRNLNKLLGVLGLSLSLFWLTNAKAADVNFYGTVTGGVIHTGKKINNESYLKTFDDGSNVGVKLTENLGGNLKGNVNLEMGFNSAQGGLTLDNNNKLVGLTRQATVGLTSDVGSLKFGRSNNPFFSQVYSLSDPFGAFDGYPYNNTIIATRVSNSLFYNSASLLGLEFAGNLSLRGDNTDVKKKDINQYSLNLKYSNSGLTLAAGFSSKYEQVGVVNPVANSDVPPPATPVFGWTDSYGGVVAYTYNKMTASFGYFQRDKDGEKNRTDYSVGLVVPTFANGSVKFGFYRNYDLDSTSVNKYDNTYGIGYEQGLGKQFSYFLNVFYGRKPVSLFDESLYDDVLAAAAEKRVSAALGFAFKW